MALISVLFPQVSQVLRTRPKVTKMFSVKFSNLQPLSQGVEKAVNGLRHLD